MGVFRRFLDLVKRSQVEGVGLSISGLRSDISSEYLCGGVGGRSHSSKLVFCAHGCELRVTVCFRE